MIAFSEWLQKENKKSYSDGDIRDKLAALEHEQWAHWTTYMLDNMTKKNIERWKRQIGDTFEELSEEEKNGDREWADKVLKIINKTS